MEQSPESWWEAARNALRGLASIVRENRHHVLGIGLSGQMNGAVLLDHQRSPVRPCIIWADARTGKQCDEIHSKIPSTDLVAITGKLAVTGYTAPKLLWVREHERELFKLVRHVLLPKDYIRLRLTGELGTDASDASNTLLFDIKRCCWSDRILQALELETNWFPPVTTSTAQVGSLTSQAAGLLGLAKGTPVVAGAGDSIAEAVGSGVVSVGPVLSVIGSAGNISASSDEPIIDAQGRIHSGCHAIPNRWILTGVQQAAGLSIQWLLENFRLGDDSQQNSDQALYETWVERAASIAPGAEGLIFLPYLTGERTPHLDPLARGVFFGIGTHHKRAHLARAVFEGLAFAQRDSLELLAQLQLPTAYLVVAGGGGRSQLWRQILADVSGLQVMTSGTGHGAAFGAALLAAVGVGVFENLEEACRISVRLNTSAFPGEAAHGTYERVYPCFRRLYAQLRPVFAEAAKIA